LNKEDKETQKQEAVSMLLLKIAKGCLL